MKDSTIKNKIINSSLIATSILFIIIVWSILSLSYDNELIFPNISDILNQFIYVITSKESLLAITLTILRVIVSVLFCFIIGFIILVIYIIVPKSIYFFHPFITIMRSTPLAVVSIFIFIIMGADIGPYVITLLMTCPLVIEGLIVSYDEINKDIIDEVKTLEGSVIKKIFNVYIPIIFPYIIMTFVQSLGMSFKVIIMGEYICQTKNSIGKLLYSAKANLDMASLISYGIIIVIIVTILEKIVKQRKR